jgi:hypothetical protein
MHITSTKGKQVKNMEETSGQVNLKPKLIPIFKVSMVIFWNKYKSQKKKYMVSWVGTKTMKAKISPRYTNIEHENLKKNTKYISQKFKQNLTLMTCENMKWSEEDCVERLYLIIMLNKLKVMQCLASIYTLLGT